MIDTYINHLIKEIQKTHIENVIVSTIYIGGGTPSLLKKKHLKSIFEKIYSLYNVKNDAEITIEANPNSLTKEKLLYYKELGINRLSIGIQSLKDKCLQSLGRLHTAKQAKKVVRLASNIGFNNISADLMLGIPFLHKKDICKSVNFLSKYCNHISAYTLILEEDTPLYKEVKEEKVHLPVEKKCINQYNFAYKLLKKKGYVRYEVSSFAKPNYESRHNKKYWDFSYYLGLGLASHSYINNVRYSNPTSFEDYFDLIENDKEELRQKEIISFLQKKEEYIMLSLRKSTGINLLDYSNAFNEDLLKKKNKEITYLLQNKFIEVKDNHLYATDTGMMVLNQIILKLID